MSTTTATRTATTTPTLGSLLLTGAVATVAAAAATALVAVAGQAVGVSTEMSGAPIPAAGFAMLTVIFSVLGLAIATALRRFARRPRTAWIRTTVVLTALSFVPDVLADAAVPTKVLLVLTHVVAAAIVIPAVARRLS
jgi:flagellar biosynthesis protein FlhB